MTDRFAEAREKATAAGHALEHDPPHSLASVDRYTCTNCGRAVLGTTRNAYGGATEGPCPKPKTAPAGRVVHCKREAYDVYIGRPSKWGNPFPIPSKTYDRVADPENILGRYEEHVRSRPDLMAALPELRGKVLGCWCAPQRCHGDVLLKLVAELGAGPRASAESDK